MLQEYNKFANILANDVLSKLEGSHDDFYRFLSLNKPSRSLILGSLSDTNINYNKSKSSLKNNSLSIKFLLDKFVGSIEVVPKFSVFYKVFPTFEEQKQYIGESVEDTDEYDIAPIWQRKTFEGKSISLNSEINEYELDLTEFIEGIISDDLIFSAGAGDKIVLCDNKDEYYENLGLLKTNHPPKFKWKCKIYLNQTKYIQNNERLELIEVGMVNLSEENKSYETFLFDCHLEINLNKNEILPFIYSYDENGFIKHYTSNLRTLNCHADYGGGKIVTKHYARFNNIRCEPKDNIGDFKLTFESLMGKDCLSNLEHLYSLMCNFEEDCTCFESNDDLKNFKLSKQNFLNGINCLKENENALYALKLMNKSFYMNLKDKYSTWRIFQIVFIVSLIPEIVDKSHKRDVCDLLHVMTGGGKSEAYFGVVIFASFYDRIIGKLFGVTALTKFPLRMLSIQQLQRVASLFIWAEEIRLEENIKGDPFTIAYYVGNQNEDFPKDNIELIDMIDNSEKKIPGKIIDKCPICGSNVFLIADHDKYLIMHACSNCKRKFGLFYTDYEIYRVLPTFIISTVDKLAAVSSQSRIKNLFGGKLDKCSNGHGFIPKNYDCLLSGIPGCDGENISVDVDFNTGPSIIIQDEMHLIKEGFGTIDSHFESLLESLSVEFSGEHFKNIAMSATVNGADKQIKELYGKKSRIFPPNLKNNDGDEFFFENKKENGDLLYNRQIIGLKPNNVDNNTAIILSLRYVSEFIKSVEKSETFCEEYNFDKDNLNEIILNFKSILSYHLKVSDVHNTRNFVERNINDSNFNGYKIDSMTLTGDNSLDDIKSIIGQVESFSNNNINKLQLTSATNIVSHGVDIDNWNLMFFQGIPRSTAEYIQALSRVGRKYHGLIFLWFYPNRVRDLSFYQNFNEYHDILQYKVEKVPIARWTKLGFKQTFTSIFTATILNFLSDYLGIEIKNIKEVNSILSDKNNREILINFIEKAYIVNSDVLGANYFRENIKSETSDRIEYLRNYTGPETFITNVLADCSNEYFKTQTGMRGIQSSVNVKRSLPKSFKM